MKAKIVELYNTYSSGSAALAPEIDLENDIFFISMYISKKKSPGTKRMYTTELKMLGAWAEKPLAHINSWDMHKYNEYLQTQYNNEKTIQRKYSTIRGFYKWLVDMDVIAADPTEDAIEPLTPNYNPLERVLTQEEVIAILNAAKKNARNYALIAVLATTGLRVAEVCSMRWCDFRKRQQGGYSVKVVRKGNKEQMVHIRQDVMDALLRFRKSSLDQSDKNEVFSVLYAKKMKPITETQVRKIVASVVKDAGIQLEVTPHWFRHTFATLSLSSGASPRDVQSAMNHANLKTTEIYLHAMDNAVSERLDLKI